MNGDDVALIRNDLKHLATIVQELRQEFKDCNRADNERLAILEKHVILSVARVEAHDAEHRRISTSLGDLREENRATARAVGDLRGDLKKWSAIGGMASAGGITAVLEGLSRLFK